jgi:hypothetical protein
VRTWGGTAKRSWIATMILLMPWCLGQFAAADIIASAR